MAYICDDCKYIFPTKRTSCPFCGGRVYNNTISENNLLNTGYTLAPGKQKNGKDQYNKDQKNPYDDLRQAFLNNQSSALSKDDIPDVSSQKTNKNPVVDSESSPSGVDYFSQFSDNSTDEFDIPTVEPPRQTHPSDVQPQNDPYEQELRELERQRRRLNRQHRRRSVHSFITNIRWRTVFRVLFVILLVIVAVIIWQMRSVIFNSIISFLISLLPIIIIVLALWYIFRSLFR